MVCQRIHPHIHHMLHHPPALAPPSQSWCTDDRQVTETPTKLLTSLKRDFLDKVGMMTVIVPASGCSNAESLKKCKGSSTHSTGAPVGAHLPSTISDLSEKRLIAHGIPAGIIAKGKVATFLQTLPNFLASNLVT